MKHRTRLQAPGLAAPSPFPMLSRMPDTGAPMCHSGHVAGRAHKYANVVTRHSFTPAAASNFNAANRLIIQSSTYDPAGNQTAIGGYTFTYDAENRLKTSKLGEITTTYAYDGADGADGGPTGSADGVKDLGS